MCSITSLKIRANPTGVGSSNVNQQKEDGSISRRPLEIETQRTSDYGPQAP